MNYPHGDDYPSYNIGGSSGTPKHFANGVSNHTRRSSRRQNDFFNGTSDYTGSSAGTPDGFEASISSHTGSPSGRSNNSAHGNSNYSGSPSARPHHFVSGANNHLRDSLVVPNNFADSANNLTTNYAQFVQHSLPSDPHSFHYTSIDQNYPNPQTIDPRLFNMPIPNIISPPLLQRPTVPTPLSIPLPQRRGPRSPQLSPTARSPPASPTRLKKYGCSMCPKMYDRGKRATDCEIRHTGEKPYPCHGKCGDRNCDKKYDTTCGLNRHVTPRPERTVQCQNCGSWLTKQNLKRHQQNSCIGP